MLKLLEHALCVLRFLRVNSMKVTNCPCCGIKLYFSQVKPLMKSRAIYCPSCNSGIRVNQSIMTRTMVTIACAGGIVGSTKFQLPLVELVTIIVIFSFVYTYIHIHFIGLFFSLELATEDDLTI